MSQRLKMDMQGSREKRRTCSVHRGLRARRGRERRRFLWLCAGAWGLPVVYTAAAVITFYKHARPDFATYTDALRFRKWASVLYKGPWYLPTFAETRTCFNEIEFGGNAFTTKKMGSLLFYFGPLSALLVVNVVCLGRSAHRVYFLRRGNSLLQRAREEGGAAHTAGGALTQAQSILVYIKLLLCAGLLETIAEVVTWASTQSNGDNTNYSDKYWLYNHMYVYRTVGSFCDLLRALCVLWMAAPGAPGQVTALCRRLVARSRGQSKRQ